MNRTEEESIELLEKGETVQWLMRFCLARNGRWLITVIPATSPAALHGLDKLTAERKVLSCSIKVKQMQKT